MADKKLDSLNNDQNSVELTDLAALRATAASKSSPLSETRQQASPDTNNLTLDEWVDMAFEFDKKSNEDFRPTLNLGRFGLKTPEDVKKFLHSPAGEAVISEMGAKLSLDKAIQEEQQLEQREHRLLMSKIKAILFLWYLESKSHASSKVKEAIMQQNEKAIENAKTHDPEKPATATKQAINSVDSTMESFFEALKAIQAKETKLDKKMD
ncbi:MAG: hypothetical protein M1486_05290, partial [Gammaproteobacteria bacterium]|nr:hypothetical protein [Gammaproteobacteria bacterium]